MSLDAEDSAGRDGSGSQDSASVWPLKGLGSVAKVNDGSGSLLQVTPCASHYQVQATPKGGGKLMEQLVGRQRRQSKVTMIVELFDLLRFGRGGGRGQASGEDFSHAPAQSVPGQWKVEWARPVRGRLR